MKQTIDIEGLPEGWKAVAYRVPVKDVDMILDRSGQVNNCTWNGETAYIIIQKLQPRRIVLEETEEVASINEFQAAGDDKGYPKILFKSDKIWREVKE